MVAMAAHPATRRTPPWNTVLRVAGHPVDVRQLEPTDVPHLTKVFRHLSAASTRQRFLEDGSTLEALANIAASAIPGLMAAGAGLALAAAL
jgi:hypothetical protein